MEKFERNDKLRQSAKFLLLQNPNHFGNLTQLKLPGIPKAVLKKVGDTTYEEVTCVGYNPDTDILTAIVEIKQVSGYSGDACTDGSQEYVRFYLDYGNGAWVDHGVASFNIHDFGFKDDLCYAVSIKLGPKKRSCCDHKPVLPKVRAILSWNTEPPANMPNWHPIWGNRLEEAIQIDPRNAFFCKFLDDFTGVGVQKIDPVLLAKMKQIIASQPTPPKPVAPLHVLMEKCGKDKLLPLRNIYPAIAKLAADKTDIAAFEVLKKAQIDVSKFEDFILKPKFNTRYEELHCVGLDRDKNLLHGVVEIKRQAGYSGDLCTKGSREYIAFYLDFGAGWEYQGTTSVVVHDVDVPEGGLWYQAALPISLDKHRKKWCEAGRARIRGILSWAVPPAPNQPNFVPHWGDREDCWIEVRPLPKGVPEGVLTPFLESIGSMSVDKIDGAGIANGSSVGGSFTADDSSFGGNIEIAGQIANPSGNNLEYRIMVQGPSDASPQAWTKNFDVSVTTIIGPFLTVADVTQTATGDWFDYIPTTGPLVFKSVAGNILAPFKAVENGLHTVYMDVREKGTVLILATSVPEAFNVDNVAPNVDVEITSGAGNCGKFTIGEVLVGTYSMEDLHSGSLSLTITPAPEAAGGHLAITSALPAASLPPPLPGPSASNSLSYAGLTLDTLGASGNWELDTTGMDPCGYNIRIHGVDRTIVNSSGMHWQRTDIEGFCLEAG